MERRDFRQLDREVHFDGPVFTDPTIEEAYESFEYLDELDVDSLTVDELRMAVKSLKFKVPVFKAIVDRKVHSDEYDIHRLRAENEENLRDYGTGLYLRQAIKKYIVPRLDRAPDDQQHWVVCVDVQDLRGVNNGFSHATGDLLIETTAKSIQSAVRTKNQDRNVDESTWLENRDIVMRFGGDEFTVFGIGDSKIAELVANRISANHQKSLLASELPSAAYRLISINQAVLQENNLKGFEKAVDLADPKKHD